MDISTFIEHLREAIETLENDLQYGGPYADEFEVDDDVVEIPFDDGSRIRLTIEKVV